ncbi:hypothetical protein [Pseudomonas piscis]|uniref:hypothetical protein n=1 Tax=Pseudomonas piscis TaxID=2614538 RepID=UPI000A121AC4|nr:hypothetical protein [Pseudomonas piscis]
MNNAFDMELFLAGVLSGARATRQRHLRQASFIQVAIAKRWHRQSPWAWQRKHVTWFLAHSIKNRSKETKYSYKLTMALIIKRLNKPWTIYRKSKTSRQKPSYSKTSGTI